MTRVACEEKSKLPRFPSCPGLGASKVRLQRPRVGEQLRRQFPGWAKVFSQVRESATPNYRGVKILLESGLNIEAWRKERILYQMVALSICYSTGSQWGSRVRSSPGKICKIMGQRLGSRSVKYYWLILKAD